MATLKDLSNKLGNFSKQVSFTTAQAMTATVRKIEKAEKVALHRHLDNPTPFTVNSVKSKGASKSNLVARVFVMSKAASYLEPYEVGGVQQLSSKALLNPKAIRLNKYGNLAKNAISRLKAKPDVFIGEVDGVNGVWQRRKSVKSKKNKKRAKRSANGTRQARKSGRAPKLLVRFGDAQQVKPVLKYQERANRMAAVLMPGELNSALAHAFKTAK